MSGVTKNLATILSLDSTGWTKGINQAAADVDRLGARVRAGFKAMDDGIAQTKLLSTPFNVTKQVNLDLRTQEVDNQLKAALNTELLKPENLRAKVTLDLDTERLDKELKEALDAERWSRQSGTFGHGSKAAASTLMGGGGIGKALQAGIGTAGGGAAGAAFAALNITPERLFRGTIQTLSGLHPAGLLAVDGLKMAGDALVALKGYGDQMAGFVSKYNPAAAERWTRVGDDFTAVLGARMAPALELFTDMFRGVADFVHTALPDPATISAALRPLKEMGPAFRELGAQVAPTIKLMLEGFAKFLEVLGKIAKVMQETFSETGSLARQSFNKWASLGGTGFNAGLQGLGALGGSADTLKSTHGMSAVKASIMTDVGALGRENLRAAYETVNPQLEETKKTNEILKEIRNQMVQGQGIANGTAGSAGLQALLGWMF